jgi:RNA polymerase sigma factor (TIGR02999 family)
MRGVSPDSVALLIADCRHGDRAAADEWMELCHPELRRMAAARMKGERIEHTWQTTALVNELYLELVKIRGLAGGANANEQEKAAFLGFAGHLMKRLLLHHARPLYRRVQKVQFEEGRDTIAPGAGTLHEVEDALSRLAEIDPKFRVVVEMRVFEGLTGDEIAGKLGCSRRTVASHWNFARHWLEKEWAGVAGR